MKGVFVVMAVAALSACGGGGGSTTTAPSTNPGVNTPPATDGISVTNNSFSPTTVKWAWNSCTGDAYSGQICAEHSVTFDDGTGSAIQGTGTFSKTFNTPGVYNYHCSVHGALMSGSVTVQ